MPPDRPQPAPGISADALSRKIEQFLRARGFQGGQVAGPPERPAGAISEPAKPLDFVSEEDVRLAIRAGRKLLVAERAIITPAARDLGDEHRVFSIAPWRG
jgi:hypothetical protein